MSLVASGFAAGLFGSAYLFRLQRDQILLQIVCWVVGIVCLVLALNDILYALDRPRGKEKKEGDEYDFPWKQPSQDPAER